MGVLTAFRSGPIVSYDIFNMFDFITSSGPVGNSTSFTRTYNSGFVGVEVWTVTGTGFGGYDGETHFPTTGTVTGITFTVAGQQVATLTGVSVPVATLNTLLLNGDIQGVYSLAFSGADTINGSNQDDIFIGFGGGDTITGGDGNDQIAGDTPSTSGGGDDIIDGGAGNDSISGGAGTNTLTGGTGNDSITSGGTNDTLDGGDGVDSLFLSLASNSSNQNIALADWGDPGQFVVGGATFQNFESFRLSTGLGADTYSYTASTLDFNIELHGGGGNDRLVLDFSSGSSAIFMTQFRVGMNLHEINFFLEVIDIHGGAGMDTLRADGGDFLRGGGGNDDLTSLNGGNSLFGGDGDDDLESGHTGDLIIDGGAGQDRLGTISFLATALNGITFDMTQLGTETGAAYGPTTIRNIESLGVVGLTNGNDAFLMTAANIGNGTMNVFGGNGFDTATIDFSSLTTAWITSISISDFERLIFTTGSGDDTLLGLFGGDDQLNGGGGNDRLQGNTGADQLNGGDGTDTAVYMNAATVDLANAANNAGDAAGDTHISVENITGSDFNDTLYGDANNNFLLGGWGADRLEGRGGNDNLHGGHSMADDILLGGEGFDLLTGDSGNDLLIGGAGADQLDGGFDSDTASYEDALTGVVVWLENTGLNTGDALGDNYTSIENLSGSVFNDELHGNMFANVIMGLGGNDRIQIDPSDQLFGGDGADTFFMPANGFITFVTGVLNGGDGEDTWSFEYDSGTASLATGIYSGSGEGTLTLTSVENLRGGAGIDNLQGDGAANRLWGGGDADFLEGGGGNDVLEGEAGADVLVGGAGVDTLNGGDGVDTASYNGAAVTINLSLGLAIGGDADSDTFISVENLSGTNGADTLTGNGAANALSGSGGNDVLDGGAGADAMSGGLGDDVFVIDNAGDTVTENANEGTDTIRSGIGVAALAANVENLVMLGAAVTANGNALNNTITGNGANNSINGQAGADNMSGGLGNDTYFVDNAGDVVTENSGEGTDIIFSTINIASLAANVENLTISGAALTATGNFLNNTIAGNSQNNTLNGGSGEDTLIGGIGNDLYLVNSAGDVVTEGLGAGTDSILAFINIDALVANVENVTLAGTATSATGNDLSNILTGNGLDNTLVGGLGNDQLNGGVGADTMSGGGGDDAYLVENAGDVTIELSGEGNNDIVYAFITLASLADNIERVTITGVGNLSAFGNALANRINGNAGNNALGGFEGNDVIQGLAGADNINGGLGLDIMTGGADADLFIFTTVNDSGITGATRDVINDFTQGSDIIHLGDIDAITGGGDDAFSLIGTAAFSNTAGELRFDQIDNASGADYTIISMDVNGDGIADSQITLVGLVTLTVSDFGL